MSKSFSFESRYQIVRGFVLIRRWIYKKTLWNTENSLGMLETLFTLKVTVFFHVSFDNRSWIKKWQHVKVIFGGLPQAPRVRILRMRLGENHRRDEALTPFRNQIARERCKNAIQIYTYIFGQHMYVYMCIYIFYINSSRERTKLHTVITWRKLWQSRWNQSQ